MRRTTASNSKLQRSHEIQKITGHLLALAVQNASLDEILRQCLDMILAVPRPAFDRTGSIFITQNDSDLLEMRVQKGVDRGLLARCRHIQAGRCLCGLAAQKKKIIFAGQTNRDHAFSESNPVPHGHYCVPMIFSQKVLGVLNIRVKAGHRRTKTEEELLTAIANTLAGIVQRKKTEEALARTYKALRTLSACNHTLIHAIDEKKLLTEVCRIIVRISGYEMVWIGAAENDKSKSVRPLAWAGNGRGYLTAAKITWSAKDKRGCEPTGTAIRTGKISINKNFEKDPQLSPWKKEAAKRGFYSSLAIPLKSSRFDPSKPVESRRARSVFGVITIYSAEADAFDKKETGLLRELAGDLAFGLETLRLRKAREQAETEKNQAEKQLLESYKHLGTINRQISILLDLYTQSGGKNAREILEYIAKSAYNLSRADSIKFFRYHKQSDQLIFLPIGNGRRKKFEKIRVPVTKHAFLKPLIEKKIRVQGSYLEDLHADFIPSGSAVKYFLFLPILSGKQLRGALLFGFSNRHSITPQELDFFEAFAAQASLVLKNLEIFKEKRIKKKTTRKHQPSWSCFVKPNKKGH